MEYEEKELNRYFLEGHWKSMIDEEEMIDDDVKLFLHSFARLICSLI